MTHHLTKSFRFLPGYSNPTGQHPAHIAWELIGPAGAVVLEVNLGYYAGTRTRAEPHPSHQVYLWGIHIHAKVPQSPGQEPTHPACKFTGGKECYGWTTSHDRDKLLDKITLEGEDFIWPFLTELYNDKLRDSIAVWEI